MRIKKLSAALLSAVIVTMNMGAVNTMAEEKSKIYIVGDSTACEYGSDDNYAVPRAGWGMYLGKYTPDTEVVDLAKSGRSSKSLTVEEEYQTLLKSLKKGDYLLIQFGHNDAKKSSEEDIQNRYTDPEGDKDTEGSFKNSLYTNYIKVAEKKGAKPILITPISRRSFNEDGTVKDTHGLYDDCVRELAKELDIPCVDATELTAELYNDEGLDGTAAFHAIYKDVAKGDKGHDNTHLNHYGAQIVAYMIAKGLRESGSDISELISFSGGNTDNISRYDFTYGIVRTIGGEYAENMGETFFDVDVLSSDTTAIFTAKKLGIITGDDKGNFNPSAALSLQDLCTITARALKSAGVELNTDTAVLEDYARAEDIKPYAKESYAALLNLWGDTIPNVNPRTVIDKGSAYAVYSLVYDEINEADENAEAQSIDEIEKVE